MALVFAVDEKKMNTLLLFIFLGGTMLQLVTCYSDGNFDNDQDICYTMKTNHYFDITIPNGTIYPFTITPECASTTSPYTIVTLRTNERPFSGFMLEARDYTDTAPVGVFSLMNSTISRLQLCNGINNTVTQTNNQNKTVVSAIWTAPATGQYCFVVTFVEHNMSWNRTSCSPLCFPTTTIKPSASATDSTTQNATLPLTTVFSTSTNTSAPTSQYTASYTTTKPTVSTPVTPATPVSTSHPTSGATTTTTTSDRTTVPTLTKQCKKGGTDGFLSLLLVSYLFIAEALHLLVKHRKRNCLTSKKVCSILSSLCSVVAFILILVYTKLVAAQVLTGLAVLFCMCQITVIFLFRGPTHELRRHCCLGFGVIAFVNLGLTAAAIFVGLFFHKYNCYWLIVVMAVYLACDVLFFLYYMAFGCKKLENVHEKVASQDSCWKVSFIISTLVNVGFTLALIIGLCLCQYCNVS